jgi:hypothetical protein
VTWPSGTTTKRPTASAAPSQGARSRIAWNDLTEDHKARSEDPDDLTKVMYVAQDDHTQWDHRPAAFEAIGIVVIGEDDE